MGGVAERVFGRPQSVYPKTALTAFINQLE